MQMRMAMSICTGSVSYTHLDVYKRQGKTTLLNCISTIDMVSAGHIYLDGTDVTEINEKQLSLIHICVFIRCQTADPRRADQRT